MREAIGLIKEDLMREKENILQQIINTQEVIEMLEENLCCTMERIEAVEKLEKLSSFKLVK